MSELQTFAAAVLASWHEGDTQSNGPIPVGDFLDRVFPYALARRRLGIDVSEDYEALALRLIAQEGGFAEVTPPDAAELARVTMSEKLPDLAVLQLLRGARFTLSVKPAPQKTVVAPPAAPPKNEKWQSPAAPVDRPRASVATDNDAAMCWSCGGALPVGRTVKFCPECGADQRQPVCQTCNEPLEREWKHCAECGTRVEKPLAAASRNS